MAAPATNAAGWIKLQNQALNAIGPMRLLSDGTVMAQEVANNTNGDSPVWERLIPDGTGGYTNGIWTNTISPMHYSRKFFASQILQNGNIFVAGAEYSTNGGGTNGEVYNPFTDIWTVCPNTPGVVGFEDAISEILPDGNVLIGPKDPSSVAGFGGTMIWNTSAGNWEVGPPLYRGDDQNEASWVKLKDESILTIDPFGQNSERYIPSLNSWQNDGNVPVELYDPVGSELGPAFLLPNGNAIFIGSTPYFALYSASGTTNAGNWFTSSSLPNGLGAPDAPAAMMKNGKILCALSPTPFVVGTNNHTFPTPTYFYEYDYSSGSVGSFTPVLAPNGTSSNNTPTWQCNMLDLPDGTVLFSDEDSVLYVYVPGGSSLSAGKPAINSISWTGNNTVTLTGTLFNGISEGAAYGDDAQMNSNFPLVEFISGGTVYFGQTFNWSSTGVMTGSQIVSTECTVPIFLPPGPCTVEVIANGIASNPFNFQGPVWVNFSYNGQLQAGTFFFPFETLQQGTNAVSDGGAIFINASTQPSQTGPITISTPTTIISMFGPSTIGK